MKKLLVFILLLSCLGVAFNFKIEKNPIFLMNEVEKVCFVSEKAEPEFESVQCGEKFFNFCTLKQARENIKLLEIADSFQFYIENLQLSQLLDILKFEECSCSKLEGLIVYCGYTPYAKKHVVLEGEKVNVQIAVKDDKLIAGFPMILTGY